MIHPLNASGDAVLKGVNLSRRLLETSVGCELLPRAKRVEGRPLRRTECRQWESNGCYNG